MEVWNLLGPLCDVADNDTKSVAEATEDCADVTMRVANATEVRANVPNH